MREARDLGALSNFDRYKRYEQLDDTSLGERIREEHDRAIQIDEKTTKFTLSFSIAFSVIGAIGVLIARQSSNGNLNHVLAGLLAIATSYTIVGGLIALGSLRTLPKYGYGTEYRLSDGHKRPDQNNKKVKVEALAAQEIVNTVRHLRNEAAYQCLRNGLICLVLSIPLIVYRS